MAFHAPWPSFVAVQFLSSEERVGCIKNYKIFLLPLSTCFKNLLVLTT